MLASWEDVPTCDPDVMRCRRRIHVVTAHACIGSHRAAFAAQLSLAIQIAHFRAAACSGSASRCVIPPLAGWHGALFIAHTYPIGLFIVLLDASEATLSVRRSSWSAIHR